MRKILRALVVLGALALVAHPLIDAVKSYCNLRESTADRRQVGC